MKPKYSSLTAVAFCALAAPGVSQGWLSMSDATNLLVSNPNLPYTLDTLGDVNGPDASEADMASGDLDLDGDLDVVIVRKGPGYDPSQRSSVLLVQTNGTLVDRTAQKAPEFLTELRWARDVQIAFINGDPWPDVVIANTLGQDPDLYINQRATAQGVWRGFERVTPWFETEAPVMPPNNSFADDPLPPGYTDPGLTTCALACADVDDDGDTDVFLGNYIFDEFQFRNRLLINDGTGFFTEESTARLPDPDGPADGLTTGVDFADFDGDDDLDYVVTNVFEGTRLVYNDGTGHFNTTSSVPAAMDVYMHAVLDIDDDGAPDVYSVGDLEDHTTLNDNGGFPVTWATPVQVVSPDASLLGGNAKAHDMDGDERPDVLLSDLDVITAAGACGDGPPANKFAILRNRGFPPPTVAVLHDPFNGVPQSWSVDAWDLAIVDVNEDMLPDVLLATCEGLVLLVHD